MQQGAVGSVLAAVGTALPETVIPVVALMGAALTDESAGVPSEVGIGAILGAPFLLATLAPFVVGVSALGFRHRRESGTEIALDKGTTRRDIGVFLVFFGIAAGAGLVPLPFLLKVLFAALLVGAYVFYVWRTIKSGGGAQEHEAPEDLRLWPEASWDKALYGLSSRRSSDRWRSGYRRSLLRGGSRARLGDDRYTGRAGSP